MNLHIYTGSSEPSLLAYTKYECNRRPRQKFGAMAPWMRQNGRLKEYFAPHAGIYTEMTLARVIKFVFV